MDLHEQSDESETYAKAVRRFSGQNCTTELNITERRRFLLKICVEETFKTVEIPTGDDILYTLLFAGDQAIIAVEANDANYKFRCCDITFDCGSKLRKASSEQENAYCKAFCLLRPRRSSS